MVVNAGLLFILTEKAGFDYRYASFCAIESAIVGNFIFNSIWTWGDRPVQGVVELAQRFMKFNGSSGVVALSVNWGLLVLLTETVGLNYQLSNLVGIALGTGANFLISHYWTFRPSQRQKDRVNGKTQRPH